MIIYLLVGDFFLRTPGHGGSNPRNYGVFYTETSCESAQRDFMKQHPKGYAECVKTLIKEGVDYWHDPGAY
jgi:hypothetical protein